MNPRIEIRRMWDKIQDIERRLIQIEETATRAENAVMAKGTSIPGPDNSTDAGITELAARLDELVATLAGGVTEPSIPEPEVVSESVSVPEPEAEATPEPEEENEEEEEEKEDLNHGKKYFRYETDTGSFFLIQHRTRKGLYYFDRDLGRAIGKGNTPLYGLPDGKEIVINNRTGIPALRNKKPEAD